MTLEDTRFSTQARTFTDALGVTIREEEFDVSVVESVVSEEVIHRRNRV